MDEKALAIFDIAMKISQNTPTDVQCWYSGHTNSLEVRIYWVGWENDEHDCSDFIAFFNYKEDAIAVDDALRTLEEIWKGHLRKEETA